MHSYLRLQIAHVLVCETKYEGRPGENEMLLRLICWSQAFRAVCYHCSFWLAQNPPSGRLTITFMEFTVQKSNMFVGDQLPPCLAVCNLESTSAMYFWLLQLLGSIWMCREERRALSVVGRGSWRKKRAGRLLHTASPQKQLSQSLRLVNYKTTTAPCWASQTDWPAA